MQDFEKLGVFYSAGKFDPASRSLKDELVLYDSGSGDARRLRGMTRQR